MSVQVVPPIIAKASFITHLYFFTEGPLSLFVFDLCANESCEAVISSAGAEVCIAIHLLISGALHSGVWRENSNRAAGLGLKSALRVSAHIETDLFVRLNDADKIIDWPAVWKLWKGS